MDIVPRGCARGSAAVAKTGARRDRLRTQAHDAFFLLHEESGRRRGVVGRRRGPGCRYERRSVGDETAFPQAIGGYRMQPLQN